ALHDGKRRLVDAVLGEIGARQVGEHRDAQKLERRDAPAAHRGCDGLAIHGMHGEERGAALRDGCRRALDGGLDIEELCVDKHRAAHLRELMHEREAAREQELEPDLVDANAVTELVDQILGIVEARHIERDNQAVAGEGHERNFFAAMASASTTVLHSSCCPLSLRLPSVSNASMARGTAICCGITVAPMPTSRIWRSWSKLRIAP